MNPGSQYCRQFAAASLWRRVLLDVSKVPYWYFQRIPSRLQRLKDTRFEKAIRRRKSNTIHKHISTNPMQSPMPAPPDHVPAWRLKYPTARGPWVGARPQKVPPRKPSAGGNDQATTKEAHRNGGTRRPGPTARQRQTPGPDRPHSHNTTAGSQSTRFPLFIAASRRILSGMSSDAGGKIYRGDGAYSSRPSPDLVVLSPFFLGGGTSTTCPEPHVEGQLRSCLCDTMWTFSNSAIT